MAIADALETATSLTSLNGCSLYAGIRAGGQRELTLGGSELGVVVAWYLPRSAATLETLDLRCCCRALLTLSCGNAPCTHAHTHNHTHKHMRARTHTLIPIPGPPPPP